MVNIGPKNLDNGKEESLSSLDEALLEEFFSTIAGVAIRLTKDKSSHNNEIEDQDAKGEY